MFWEMGRSGMNRMRVRPTNQADKNWARAVKQRDDWTCQVCGYRNENGSDIHAHHIKPYSKYPELRYEVSNGATLCMRHNLELGNKEHVRLSYRSERWFTK